MLTRLHTDAELCELELILGIEFKDRALLREAFIHSSFINEFSDISQFDHGIRDSERLEFLGDAVLGLVVTSVLYSRCVDANEGELSLARSHVVRKGTLASVALDMGLSDYIVLSKGESRSSVLVRESILEDAYEALVGAIYLDGGMGRVREFVLATLGEVIEDVVENGVEKDPKSAFQELVQANGFSSPTYETSGLGVDSYGRARYESWVKVGDKCAGNGFGFSKVSAQRDAASSALELFGGSVPPEFDVERVRVSHRRSVGSVSAKSSDNAAVSSDASLRLESSNVGLALRRFAGVSRGVLRFAKLPVLRRFE